MYTGLNSAILYILSVNLSFNVNVNLDIDVCKQCLRVYHMVLYFYNKIVSQNCACALL